MAMKKKRNMMMMMKLPTLFKSSEDKSAWPWPSCRQPRTLSFRISTTDSSDSVFTISSDSSGSLSTASDSSGGDPIERMIRGVMRSERLQFQPAGKSMIVKEKEKEKEEKGAVSPPLKEGTRVMSMDSEDPFSDFRESMEEMVEAFGLKDWESLEELLSWYLRVNGKGTHGFILGAFVDLLLTLPIMPPSSSSSSSSISRISPLSIVASSSSSSSSSFSSASFLPCVSSSMEIEEITSLEEDAHVFS